MTSVQDDMVKYWVGFNSKWQKIRARRKLKAKICNREIPDEEVEADFRKYCRKYRVKDEGLRLLIVVLMERRSVLARSMSDTGYT